MLANSLRQHSASLRQQRLRIIKPDNASFRIQDDRGSHHRTEQRSAPHFINSSYARPTKLPRRALKSRRTNSCHFPPWVGETVADAAILARHTNANLRIDA